MGRNNTPIDLKAGADLSTKEYCFGKYSSGGVVACSVLGERADLVIGNAPIAGAAVSAQVNKKIRVKVGAVGVADGAELTTNATSLAITAVATNIVFCKALEAGAAGAIIDALVVPAYAKP